MESFHSLDFDWEGKQEPSSPLSQDSAFAAEDIILDYTFCNDDLFNNALFDVIIEDKPIIKSELMQDSPMLIELPPLEKVAKDQWLGQKLKMPQLAGSYLQSAVVPLIAPEIGPFQPQPAKVQNTEELLMEFDCVYENVELTHLTPPQTPPQEVSFVGGQVEQQQSAPVFLAVQPEQQQVPTVIDEYYGFGAPLNGLLVNSIQTIVQQAQQVPGEFQLANSFGFQPVDEENIARNLELVEEIVRSRSKDLPDCNEDDDSCSYSEADSSSPQSDSSSSSSYCGSAYSRDQDDEWSPTSSSSGNRRTSKTSGGGVSKKRTRPYGRGVEDKKSRKKEQNKNAATRYRQKKKAEIEEILIEENQLRDINEELKSKSADIGREIRYLKSLMREVYKAKGLI
ncbi:hypothetical protein pipiens_005125 [Culex pipiens pipiens]|uniref:Activating transcription factor of chaperone n=2 Tax=Culex pipiens TaxID=7175 RepID=A0A8D8LCH6_CULPI